MSTPQSVEESTVDERLPKYYKDINCSKLLSEMKNLDDVTTLKALEHNVTDPYSRNFLVDFGDDDAWSAFNLDVDTFAQALAKPRPSSLYTRWINIWYPSEHQSTLEVIAKRYDLSPRLLGLMCSDPRAVKGNAAVNDSKGSSSFFAAAHQPLKYLRHLQEQAIEMEEGWKSLDMSNIEEPTMLPDMSHYQIVNEVWHYSSVDWGRKYVCIGYNALYNVRLKPSADVEEKQRQQDLPEGKRIWNWLLLCDDRTVISITEDPFPFNGGHFSPEEQANVLFLRRNLLNIFLQISKAKDTTKKSPLTTLPIRKSVGNSHEETLHRPSDAPGLLFFFLFEDWYSCYSLVIRREHRYQAELNQIRQDMLHKAELKHINRLHHIGRQLAVLKRLYQTYESIVDHVLEKQTATMASLANSHIIATTENSEQLSSSQPQVAEEDSLLGVSLSSAARVRFLRLKHRIRLYALAEIQDCLDQKESLVMMNFNLIAIKESYAVERLTRITLLLGKVTILFMPVSLMSAYFGAQFTDAQFTVKSYWIWFVVIFVISALALVIFGAVSGTMEGAWRQKKKNK
ncbi:MAG: hypothetical protein M1822_007926 [Bathelium mastoideum]|nr:MAG: hypothetical protein M1822_007926 [Bathelium mastoideum]